jgi:acyl-CoA thioester hydrolase
VAAPFVHELRVRYGECDPQGIVFNANYVAYFDVAFTELWREALGTWQEMVERGVDAVVAEVNVRFRAPARFDDLLQLQARVARLGTTSTTTEIDVVRDGQVLVEGRLRHVFLDTGTWQKTQIPDWVRGGLEPFVLATAGNPD